MMMIIDDDDYNNDDDDPCLSDLCFHRLTLDPADVNA